MNSIKTFFFLFLILISCKKNESEHVEIKKTIDTLKAKTGSKKEAIAIGTEAEKFADTVWINYEDNKILLEILQKIPDKSMGTWEWSKEERKEMVKSISKNNYYIDTTKNFNDIKYIKPNTIETQVIDGYWTMSIYKIKDNNYIVITNDITGDGKDLIAYEYKERELIDIDIDKFFENIPTNLLKQNDEKNCTDLLEDGLLIFDFDFRSRQFVTISSETLNEDENGNCLKGNSLNYKFIPQEKTFELESINWRTNSN